MADLRAKPADSTSGVRNRNRAFSPQEEAPEIGGAVPALMRKARTKGEQTGRHTKFPRSEFGSLPASLPPDE